MSNPKTITTAAGHRFHPVGHIDEGKHLFQVVEGVDIHEALSYAADLVNMAKTPAFEAGMGNVPLEGNQAWLVYRVLEAAEAVICSAVESLEGEQMKRETAGH